MELRAPLRYGGGMLRLLLILLASALPLPAAAGPACHQPATATTHADHHAPREREPVSAPHVCIDCATVAAWLRAPIAAPILPPALSPRPRLSRIDPGQAAPPALPPPRLA